LDALERWERGDQDKLIDRQMEMTNWAFVDYWGLPGKLVSRETGIAHIIDGWRREFNYEIPQTHKRWASNNMPGAGLR
jgi:hypothetical protein